LSESKAHFKVKKDNIEIEYEGNPSEVDARFKEIFEWVKTQEPESSSKNNFILKEKTKDTNESQKKTKYSKGVTSTLKEMVNGNFLMSLRQ
jgi:hypothetical protein